jgi:hypothetical protein
MHDRNRPDLDVPAGAEPRGDCVHRRVALTGALVESDACPQRDFGSLALARAVAECDASAARPSRSG